MNAKTWSIILVVIALNLGIGWFLTSRQARQNEAAAAARINSLSNSLVEATTRLTLEQKSVMVLRTNLVTQSIDLGALSNRWTEVAELLAKSQADSRAAAEAAQVEIEKRDRQITDLEGEREGLTKQMEGLTSEIGTLRGRISDTEHKLAASEGDRAQLQRELRRMLSEKSELERKFNDLALLRDQVQKLKEEVSVARRADLTRRGLYGMDKKGAQLLNEGFRRPAVPAPTPGTEFPVEAELGTDGSIRVNTPAVPSPPK